MNTNKEMNMMELSLNDMASVNGGINWDRVAGASLFGGSIGMAAAGIGLLCIGPIGWATVGVLAGGAAVGATVGGGIAAAVTAND